MAKRNTKGAGSSSEPVNIDRDGNGVGMPDQGVPVVMSHAEEPPLLAGHATAEIVERVYNFYDSVAQIYDSWLNRNLKSPNTRRAYHNAVMKFVEGYLGLAWPKQAAELLKVTVPQVQAYQGWLIDTEKAAPKTVNHRLTALGSFYKYLREAAIEMRLPINVPNPAHAQFVPRPAADPIKPTPAMGADQVRQIFALADGDDVLAYRDRAILKCFFYSAVRIGTACRLNVGDFRLDDEDEGVLRVREKGGRRREIGIHVLATLAIKEYIAKAELSRGPLFRPRLNPRSRKLANRHLDESTMYRTMMDYFERLPGAMREVECRDGSFRRECIYSPHTARATPATLLLLAGEDIAAVRDLLGHKSVTTTEQGYDRRKRGIKDSASKKVPV